MLKELKGFGNASTLRWLLKYPETKCCDVLPSIVSRPRSARTQNIFLAKPQLNSQTHSWYSFSRARFPPEMMSLINDVKYNFVFFKSINCFLWSYREFSPFSVHVNVRLRSQIFNSKSASSQDLCNVNVAFLFPCRITYSSCSVLRCLELRTHVRSWGTMANKDSCCVSKLLWNAHAQFTIPVVDGICFKCLLRRLWLFDCIAQRHSTAIQASLGSCNTTDARVFHADYDSNYVCPVPLSRDFSFSSPRDHAAIFHSMAGTLHLFQYSLIALGTLFHLLLYCWSKFLRQIKSQV